MKTRHVVFGIAVSVLCLCMSVRGMNWGLLLETLRHVDVVKLAPPSCLFVVGMVARARRWRLIIGLGDHGSTRRLFHLTNIGYLLNNVFPMRIGDVVRGYLCAQAECFSVARGLSTILIERVADILSIVAGLTIVLWTVALPASVAAAGRTAGALGLLAAGLFLLMGKHRDLCERVLLSMAIKLPRPVRRVLSDNVRSVVQGLAALDTWQSLVGLMGWSLVIWATAVLQFWLLMPTIGLELPLIAAMAVVCVTSLGMAIPSSPGYVGVFEYLTVLSLSAFDVPQASGLGYALVLHGSMYLATVVLGLLGAAAQGLSLARLRHLAAASGPQCQTS